jgi:hypothetical protein
MFTITSLPSYIACHDSLDPLFQTLGIWIQGSGAAVSHPGTRDYPRGTLHLGYGMGHGPRPTSVITTHNVVGLLMQ